MTGMLRVAVLLVLAVGCSALDTYAQERLKQEACEDHCAKAYASVGDLKSDNRKACERGCRLFSLVKISELDKDGAAASVSLQVPVDPAQKCENACSEAYPAPKNQKDAAKNENVMRADCHVGCQHGAEVHAKKSSTIKDQLRFRDPIMADLVEQLNSHDVFNSQPFQMMNKMMDDMMKEMNRMFTFSWSSGDANSVFQPPKPVEREPIRVSFGQPGIIVVRTSHNYPQEDCRRPSALPDMDDPFDELRGSNTRFMDKDPVRKIKTPAAVREEEPRSNDWLESVSRKAGIPRWLLLSSVFLCSLMFVWLCFAATGPVPEQRVYAISNMPPAYSCKQPWSEIPYIIPAEKTVIDKVNEDVEKGDDKALLIAKEEDAGPLPAKLHIDPRV
jgi:hypothetical protein